MEKMLEMVDICKNFPGVKALDKVSFDLNPGEVHVLLGENGAGKSTLMKILFGLYSKDSGLISLKGKQMDFKSGSDSFKSGVRLIPQELNLIPNLSVTENIFAGHLPVKKLGFVDWRMADSKALDILNRLEFHMDLRRRVSELSVSEQQMVAIARAFQENPSIIVFDEPTSALGKSETQKLFELIQMVKKQNVGIIYISHRMEEIPLIADRVTVMRDGKVVKHFSKEEINVPLIIKALSGTECEDERFPRVDHKVGSRVTVELKQIQYKKLVNAVDLQVHEGEILGITGFVGAGKTELSRILFGAARTDSGELSVCGERVSFRRTQDAIEKKIALIPEDRRMEGLVTSRKVFENITLPSLKQFTNQMGVLRQKKERLVTDEYVRKLSIATTNMNKRVKYLSGGNQQKIVIAKWLNTGAEIFIFDEATRGVDVRAKSEIYRMMGQLAAQGKTVINISMEFPEVIGISDRIIVMHEGRITADIPRSEATIDRLYQASGGQEL